VEQIVVVSTVYHLSISLFVPETFAIKIESCPKTHALSNAKHPICHIKQWA